MFFNKLKTVWATIAIADGASNYFVPHMRDLIEELDLQDFVYVVSYAEELAKHVKAEGTNKVHLLATGDGLKMGEHSIFAPLADVTEVITPQDTMKTIPLMIDNPEKAGKKMLCPTGATQQFVDKKNTQAIKIAKIETLLRAVKDADGNVQPEHADLLRDAISWVPDGETIVLGATELELLYLDENLKTVFDEKGLQVISPLMGLVAPAVVSSATNIKQPEIGQYRSENIPDAPQSTAPDHVDTVQFIGRLKQEQQPCTARILQFPSPHAKL